MKITMYELIGLVKDGKEPKKFKYNNFVWTYNYESSAYWNEKDVEFEDYMNNNLIRYLEDEVEIIEEEKEIPDKLSTWFSVETKQSKELNINYINTNFENMYEKINQICDYLKSKGE